MNFHDHLDPDTKALVELSEVDLFVRRFDGTTDRELVLVHGGPDWDHTYLLPVVPRLLEVTNVTVFDLRGCGRSEKLGEPEAYTKRDCASDLDELVERIGLEEIVVLGVSFGGRIALEFVRHHSERLAGLILASSTAFTVDQYDAEWPSGRAERWSAADRRRANEIMENEDIPYPERTRRLAFHCLKRDVYSETRRDEILPVIEAVEFSGEWMKAWEHGALSSDQPVDYVSHLRGSDFPVLILHGAMDDCFSVNMARELRRRIPRADLEVLADCSHLAHLERPDAWSEAVSNWLG